MQDKRRVVITGIGAVTPIGLSVDEFWNSMMNSVSGCDLIKGFDTSRVETKFACELKGFDPANYMDKKTARRIDKFSQYALAAAKMAVDDSGLKPGSMQIEDKERTGVVFGSGIGGFNTFYSQAIINHSQGPNRVSPFFIPMMIPDIASGLIAIEYGFKGPNHCVVTACATSNNNIIDSYLLISNGMADRILSGGSEAGILEIGIAGFNASRALSTRNDSPKTASRPFDATRDGFVIGEGGGVLVLEELEMAKKRDAKIYAEIIGVGVSADAHHITAPDPEGRGAILAMQMALKTAALHQTDIDYINMHGTSTGLGDIAETNAIKSLFGNYAYKMNVSSTKSMTGHLLGAAGAVEAIASILTIQNNKIPPTINFEHPDPECDCRFF